MSGCGFFDRLYAYSKENAQACALEDEKATHKPQFVEEGSLIIVAFGQARTIYRAKQCPSPNEKSVLTADQTKQCAESLKRIEAGKK